VWRESFRLTIRNAHTLAQVAQLSE
jgi:hypothetical protein